MKIFKDIFYHQNLGARDKYSKYGILFARIIYDLVYIFLLSIAYYYIFYAIDLLFLSCKIYDMNILLFNNNTKFFLFFLLFNIINFLIYIIIKLFNHSHMSLLGVILHRLIFIILKISLQYYLLVLLLPRVIGNQVLVNIHLFSLSNSASIAFLIFSIINICLNTLTSSPLWFVRAKMNTKLTGYKEIGFYTANWCGEMYYVGTANDGIGKRMYNYYTGNGCDDGEKFRGMRLGLRFRTYKSSNPDSWESLFYIIFGAPYRNRENPLRSQNVKKTSNYRNRY